MLQVQGSGEARGGGALEITDSSDSAMYDPERNTEPTQQRSVCSERSEARALEIKDVSSGIGRCNQLKRE